MANPLPATPNRLPLLKKVVAHIGHVVCLEKVMKEDRLALGSDLQGFVDVGMTLLLFSVLKDPPPISGRS
jgi:hypothetical protein